MISMTIEMTSTVCMTLLMYTFKKILFQLVLF